MPNVRAPKPSSANRFAVPVTSASLGIGLSGRVSYVVEAFQAEDGMEIGPCVRIEIVIDFLVPVSVMAERDGRTWDLQLQPERGGAAGIRYSGADFQRVFPSPANLFVLAPTPVKSTQPIPTDPLYHFHAFTSPSMKALVTTLMPILMK